MSDDGMLKYTERDMTRSLRSAAALARCTALHFSNSVIHPSSITAIPCWECSALADRNYPMPKRLIPNVLDDPSNAVYQFRVDPDSRTPEIQSKSKREGEDEWRFIGDNFFPFAARIRVWYELLEHPLVETDKP